MEFEIIDEPQGLIERPDADRDGGLREDPVDTRKLNPRPLTSAPHYEEQMLFSQMG